MTKHGHGVRGEITPTYTTWVTMRHRCHWPNNSKYYMYGARGITVCLQWFNSFEAFLADMGPRPAGHTIDRIDGSKGYEPGNCRWVTSKEQQYNLRTNVMVTFRGETKCLAEWATICGVPGSTIGSRLRRGWSPEQALTIPARLGNRVKRADA